MRRRFFKLIHELMAKDKDIYFLTGNLGYVGIDPIKKDYPERYIDCGAAECGMVGAAVGLSLSGKKVFCYSITPFLLWRPAEWIRNYLDYESIPVCLCGSGREDDYKTEGFTHYAGDDYGLMSLTHGVFDINSCWPETEEEMEQVVKMFIKKPVPTYLNLKR